MKKSIWLLCLVIFLLAALSASAMEIRTGDRITVAADEVISDDLLALGQSVTIDGTVEGDVIAMGYKVAVGGEVGGSVMAAGRFVSLPGKVGGSARLGGNTVIVSGEVGRNLAAAGEVVSVEQSAKVGSDVHLGAANMEVAGQIGRNATLAGANIALSAVVAGDVKTEADRFALEPGANIAGNLIYRTPRETAIPAGASVAGETIHLLPKMRVKSEPRSPVWLLFPLWKGLALLVTGIVLLAISRRRIMDAVNAVSQPAWKSLLFGFMVLVATPFAVVLLCITILGLPLGLLLGLAWMAALIISGIPVAISLGRWLLQKLQKGRAASPYVSLFAGLVIICLLAQIPYAGWVIRLLVLFFGMGALSRAAKGMLMGTRATP
jgi:cytoskeletal protein CcmA (bactofilin family)